MPKGQHYGRAQTRAYTGEYPRIHANLFKPLLEMPLGNYLLDSEFLDDEHKKLTLKESGNGIRYVTFTINEKPHQIALKLDNSSASNKLYITCPYCHKQRQSLTLSNTPMVVGNVLAYITPARVKDQANG